MDLDLEEHFRDFHLDDNPESDHHEREENCKERFMEAKKDIKTKKRFVHSNDVDQFFEKYGDIVGSSLNKPAGNLLHTLVDVVTHNGIQPEEIELLVRRLVKEHPSLLNYENEEKYNPIFMAIKASHHQLVNYMVTTCVAMKAEDLHEQSLDIALRTQMTEGKTCLHLAIEAKFDSKTRKILVENASDEALAVQDDAGKTPMHYAAVFGRCTDPGVELINLFIERDLKSIKSTKKPLKTFLDLYDNSGASVYQQHYATRASGMKLYEKWLGGKQSQSPESITRMPEASKAAGKPQFGEPRPQMGSDPVKSTTLRKAAGDQGARLSRDNAKDDVQDEREKQRQMKKAAEDEILKNPELLTKTDRIKERDVASRDASQARSNKLSEPDESTAQSKINRAANYVGQLEATPNMSLKRRVTARAETKPDQEEERPAAKPKQKKPDLSEYMPILIKNTNDILLSLKLHYMRTRSTEMVISFLYGGNMQGERNETEP